MLKLLIVDDEKRTREGLIKCLPWKSMQIGTIKEADDGITALELAETFYPDIVLSDIRMPNMEGIEFVRRLGRILPDCKVIFISGYSDKEYLKSAIQLKVVSYVEKPVNIGELKQAVQDAVDMCLKGKKNLKHFTIIKESKPFIIQEFIRYLQEPGCTRTELESIHGLTELDLNLDGFYVAVIFKLFISKSISTKIHLAQRSILLDHICSTLNDNGITNITGVKDESCIISYIQITPDSKHDSLKKVLEGLSSNLNSSTTEADCRDMDYSIGVGLPVHGMEKLHQSYQMAVIAEQRSFFLGSRKPIFYENATGQSYGFNNDIEETFSKYLSHESVEMLLSYVDKLTKEINKHEDTLVQNAKSVFYRLLLILYTESEKRNISICEQGTTKENLWSVILDFNTLEQIKNYIKTKIEIYFSELGEKSDKSKVVYEIIQYIRNNYNQSELDLNSISQHIHLTPAYLCQIFKKKTGVTINEYVTEYRIEKAKELLRDGNAKLYEVATGIGYRDTKYFIRTFRKKTGVTPTEYRELY